MNKAFRSAALFFMVEQHDGKRGGLFSYLWRQNRQNRWEPCRATGRIRTYCTAYSRGQQILVNKWQHKPLSHKPGVITKGPTKICRSKESQGKYYRDLNQLPSHLQYTMLTTQLLGLVTCEMLESWKVVTMTLNISSKTASESRQKCYKCSF